MVRRREGEKEWRRLEGRRRVEEDRRRGGGGDW